MIRIKQKNRRCLAAALALLVLAVPVFASAAQVASTPVGGFSLTLPDRFAPQSYSQDEAPDLCFFWRDNSISIQAYAVYLGEVAGSDLFQVLTGSETDSGLITLNGMPMLYAAGSDLNGNYFMYSWMDRGNNVTLYFYYPEGDRSARETIENIMASILFDAGH